MEKLGKYRIEAKLGEGAMGFVYKAWHPGFNDYVALKTIQDTRLQGGELLDRFKLEGQALAKLKHTNIVQIYDADQANGVHFIVMEYMNGGSLDRIITRRDETVPLAKRVGYIVPVCNALEYAHKRRLFHRDIKPANIMLHIDGDEEIVKVVDFGIARLVDSTQTQTKLLIGAPAYMAPELVTATAKANEKTDIWAVGVTLYELISYRRPFEGNTIEELSRNIVRSQPKPLTQVVPDCPKDLAAVVDKTLQKEPGGRYQSVEELLIDLEPIAKRLRAEFADTLVRRAKDFIEIEEFESAKSALDEARKYDATNLQARSLLPKVQDELKRGQLLPRLQEHVRVGRSYLSTRQYPEARAAAEQAIGLDSRYEPAHKLLEEIQSAEALEEEIEQKVTYARRYISEGELTQASKLIDDIFALDADNREASELGARIRILREELDHRKKLSQFLRSADEFIYAAKYDECLSLISEALREFPGNSELQKRKENALAEKSEQDRLLLLNNARKLRTSQQFDQALEVLSELLTKFPGDSTGTALRYSIQKERDQDRLNKQLGLEWEKLRALKHQGEFSQALHRAKELANKFPSEERIQDFIRELELELKQNQLHAQLDAAVTEIEELIRNGRFSEAITATEDALRLFPDNQLLASLQKKAKSQQQRKEILEKQNDCLVRVRQLVSVGQFKEAAGLAQRGLDEFGEHAGLREALADANRYYSSEVDRIRRQDQAATQIDDFCATGDVGSATRILNEAEREGVIEKGTPVHATSTKKIEGAKDKQEKEREERIELRRRELRHRVDQKEFASAVRLADELERDFGPDREVLDLRHNAEAGLLAEQNARQERDEVLQRASNFVTSGNIAAADQILRNSIDAGILKKSDPQVVALLAKTKDLLDRDKERKKRVQQVLAELGELLRKRKFAEAIELGQRALKSDGHQDEIADLVRQAEIALAKHENLQKRRLAEIRSIRGLLEDGNVHQAKTLLEDALQREVLDLKDQEVVELQKQIAELNSRQSKVRPAIEELPGPLTSDSTGGKKWTFGAVAVVAVVLSFTIGLTAYLKHQPKPLPNYETKITAARDFITQFRWDDADEVLKELPNSLPEYSQLKSQIDAGHKENGLMADAREAEQRGDYTGAQEDYQKVIDLHLDQEAAATNAKKSVDEIIHGASVEKIAQDNFDQGVKAYSQDDYAGAQKLFQEALSRAPQGWPRESQVQGYLTKAEHRLEQVQFFQVAQTDFASKDYASSKEKANRALNTPDGDPRLSDKAQDLLKKIQAREEQGKIYDEAEALKGRDPQQAEAKFQQVASFPGGDDVLVARATDEIERIGPMPNYGPLITHIEDLIGQRQFEAALDRLKELPLDQPEYARLKSAIDNGREDDAFDAKKTELGKAESEKNEPELRTLRDFFGSQQGRHHEEAVRLISRIDADLKLLKQDPPQVSEATKIQQQLNMFAQAYSSKDVVKLRLAWPNGSDKWLKSNQDAWKDAKSIRMILEPRGSPQIDGNSASIACTNNLLITDRDGRQHTVAQTLTFQLTKAEGTASGWIIKSFDPK